MDNTKGLFPRGFLGLYLLLFAVVANSGCAVKSTQTGSTATQVQITTSSFPNGNEGSAYSAIAGASNGTPPYNWNFNGALPPGLSLNATTGLISGMPSSTGQFSFTLQVRDSSPHPGVSSKGLAISIGPPSTSTTPPSGAVIVTSFGATGNGTTDDTAAINSAIATLQPNQSLWFPCGTYVVSSALGPISLDGVTIEGPGGTTNCATLKLSGTGSFTALAIVGNGLSGSENLAADTTANTFTVGSGGLASLGIVVGSYVLVSDTAVASNGAGSPPISTQQVAKVTAVSGDTATIEGTFAHTFTLVSPHPSNQGCCPYVQVIGQPVSNVSVRYLNFDGSSNTAASTQALEMNFVVNSELGFVTVANFLQTPGPTDAIALDTGYQNSFHDIICNACGNGTTSNGHSVRIDRQELATFQNISVTNTSTQYSFAFDTGSMTNSTLSNLTIDGGGANGRPFKLLRANHNTITNLTAKNGGGGKNGIDVTDISTYNTFNNCSAISNNGTGIKMFGNFNQHNTFNNCTVKYNTAGQFGQGSDSFGNYGDDFTTITGGTFCCARNGTAIIWIYSNNFTLAGAAVSDDQGQATSGLFLDAGTQAIIKNNTFAHLPANTDVYIQGAANATFSGNSTPDGTTPSPLP